MLDPQIVAAIVAAAGGLAAKLFDRSSPNTEPPETTSKAKEVILEVYPKLRAELTDNCIRVLKYLANGQNQPVFKIRQQLYPDQGAHFDTANLVDSELEYRLKYLVILGLLTPVGGGREFTITPLGLSFIHHAQSIKDYYNVFWG